MTELAVGRRRFQTRVSSENTLNSRVVINGAYGKQCAQCLASVPTYRKWPRATHGGTMSPIDTVQAAVCETFERLLVECERARRDWSEQRVAIFQLGLRGKEMDDELRCLQARFAKSYALVRNHRHDCELCKSSRRAGQSSSSEGHDHRRSSFRLPLAAGLLHARL
jgi:hypothetical protein